MLTAAHAREPFSNPHVQEIAAQRVAKGELSEEQWETIENIAKEFMNRYR